VLIIDVLGVGTAQCRKRHDLLEIVDGRYDRRSLPITSQVPVNRWHEVIGHPTLSDTILDRILHSVELKGPSQRRRLGPIAPPTRAAPSLVSAARRARGSPPWTPWMIL
jgi:DNA replication protein DnaC